MSLLTVPELQLRVETSLDITVLQGMIDAAETELARWGGGYDPVAATETFRMPGARTLRLASQPATITTVTEDDVALVEDDDWYLDGDTLYRDGTASLWGAKVVVVYVLSDRRSLWLEVVAAMVQQDINTHPGLVSTTVGSWSETYSQGGTPERDDQRYAIMSRWRESDGIS